MDDIEKALHLKAGYVYGKNATCGKKIDYQSEATAQKAAEAMTNKRKDNKQLEAYPCYWCKGWHIGRAMTEEERNALQS